MIAYALVIPERLEVVNVEVVIALVAFRFVVDSVVVEREVPRAPVPNVNTEVDSVVAAKVVVLIAIAVAVDNDVVDWMDNVDATSELVVSACVLMVGPERRVVN